MTGYLVLGAAYGFIMHDKGLGIIWVILCSLLVYAGSMQYVGITLMTSVFNPVYALLLTLMINARHLFYGISMLSKYSSAGRFKPYLIFGLTDETFSVNCSAAPPDGVEADRFYFSVTLLDHIYWVIGSVVGWIIGGFLTFDTTGLDFVLTALFVVIFLNQWMERKKHTSAIIGVACSIVSLVVFGPERFIIPAMAAIAICLFLFRGRIEKEED